MTRIVSQIAVSALQNATLEGQTLGIFESDIGGGLKGLGNDTTWDGTFDNFSGGICTVHRNGNGGMFIFTGSNFKAFWFKNTGFKFDAGKANLIDYDTPTTDDFSIAVGGQVICSLYPGEGIILLRPPQSTFVFSAGGVAPAVEHLTLRNT